MILVRSATGQSEVNQTTLQIDSPSTIVLDDLIVIILTGNDDELAAADLTPPSGFTLGDEISDATVGDRGMRFLVYTKRAVAADVTNAGTADHYDFTGGNGSDDFLTDCLVLYDDTRGLVDYVSGSLADNAETGGGTTSTAPGQTATSDPCLVVAVFCGRQGTDYFDVSVSVDVRTNEKLLGAVWYNEDTRYSASSQSDLDKVTGVYQLATDAGATGDITLTHASCQADVDFYNCSMRFEATGMTVDPPRIVSYSKQTTGGTAASQLNFTKPSGLAEGDMLLVLASNDDITATAQFDGTTYNVRNQTGGADAGFTFINHAGSDVPDAHAAAWYKVMTASDISSGSWRVDAQSSDDMCVVALRIVNYDPNIKRVINHVGTDEENGSNTAQAWTNAADPNVPGCLLLHWASFDGEDCYPFDLQESSTGWQIWNILMADESDTGTVGDENSCCLVGRVSEKSVLSASLNAISSVADGAAGFFVSIAPPPRNPDIHYEESAGEAIGASLVNSATWTDVGAEGRIEAAQFRPNTEYLLLCAWLGNGTDATNVGYEFRVAAGGSEISGSDLSLHKLEPRRTSAAYGHDMFYMQRYTTPATPVDIDIQFRVSSADSTVQCRDVWMVAFQIGGSDGLYEGRDFLWDEDTTDYTSLSSSAWQAGPSINVGDGKSKWIFFSHLKVNVDSTADAIRYRFDGAGYATTDWVELEGENTAETWSLGFLWNQENFANQDVSLEFQTDNGTAGGMDVINSRICAIRADRFAHSDVGNNGSNVNLAVQSTWYQFHGNQGFGIVPYTRATDIFGFAGSVIDAGDNNKTLQLRMQSDTGLGQWGAFADWGADISNGASDHRGLVYLGIEPLVDKAHDLSVDTDGRDTNSDVTPAANKMNSSTMYFTSELRNYDQSFDDFQRMQGTDLGSIWENGFGAYNSMEITENYELSSQTSSAAANACKWVGDTFDEDQFSEGIIGSEVDNTTGSYYQVHARMQNDNQECYLAVMQPQGDGTVDLWLEHNNGGDPATFTVLGTKLNLTHTVATGDALRIEVRTNSPTSMDLKLYLNGVLRREHTDTTYQLRQGTPAIGLSGSQHEAISYKRWRGGSLPLTDQLINHRLDQQPNTLLRM